MLFNQERKIMNIVLWVAQVLLSLAFLAVGYNHAFNAERMKLQRGMQWIDAVPRQLMSLIGMSEIAGGIGVVLPAATRILPWLTPLAAALLALVMLLVFVFHVFRHEYPNLAINAILFLLAVFVAYGRAVLLPLLG
jgi:putative oxidoreductase